MAIRYDRIQRLIQARRGEGETFRQMSYASGLPIQTLQDILNGRAKDLRVQTLAKICVWLGVEPSYLIDLTDVESREGQYAAATA
jgi:transcriptional regulator with XRE-family HTH domain